MNTAMWLLFYLGNMLVFSSLILSLTPWASFALVAYHTPYGPGPALTLSFCLTLFLVLLWLGLGRFVCMIASNVDLT